MLEVLGIRQYINPIFLESGEANRFVFEKEDVAYDMQPGIANLRRSLKKYFPSEKKAIDKYFDMITAVNKKTVSLDLRNIVKSAEFIDEDFISLQEVLNDLTKDKMLQALLSTYTMCYGVKPEEVSFATHGRVCYGLYESVARIENGGEAFIDAFKNKIKQLGIHLMCNKHIVKCEEVNNNRVGRFILNDGEELKSKNCIFTIHPHKVLDLLPKQYLNKAFIDRVSEFEPSIGFFLAFGLVNDNKPAADFKPTILSSLPFSDFNKLLDPKYNDKQALVIMRSLESSGGKNYKTVNAFEPSFSRTVQKWRNSKLGNRPSDYKEYKKQRVKRIHDRICEYYPEYKYKLEVVDSASVLTFRDYLNTPYGSAYGIKQKIAQYNLFGKLPLRNLYAAGQSAVLPGIVGALLSSFISARSIIGKNYYNDFIGKRLCG